MESVRSSAGINLAYERSGSGPPLVLVHGSFSDHRTNWTLVKPALEQQFTIFAVARRGRGDTDATEGHTVEDEANDIAALLRTIGEPVFLVGHSYGAHCALSAAHVSRDRIRRLVLYEAPWPALLKRDLARLELKAAANQWDDFAVTFFRDTLTVPAAELREVRDSAEWPQIVADGNASLGDLRALANYRFDAERYRRLNVPVLMQIGARSPRHFYVTDALAAALPDARVEALSGQAHEGMTTAPELYVESVAGFLLAGDAVAGMA